MSSWFDFFYNSNPWWEGKSVGLNFKRPTYYGILEWVFNQDISESLVLIGSRRTGKTVILHQVAETLVKHDTSVAYIPVDELVELGLGKIVDAVNFYINNLHESGKIVFLLDEVQYYDSWAREVKVLIDRFRRGRRDILFVCTGSSALGVMVGAGEALVGRAGIMRIYPMSPLEIVDFMENRGLSRWIWSNRMFVAKNSLLNPNQVLRELYNQLGSTIVEKVQRIMSEVLYWGSLIEIVSAISKGANEAGLRKRLLEIIDLTILRDILRIQKIYGSKYELDPVEASKIIKLSMLQSPFITSMNDLSTKLGFNKEKVKLAIRLAEYAGLLGIVEQYARSPMTAARKKKMKIHVMDTGLRMALRGIPRRIYLTNSAEIGKNIENFVLSRLYPILHTLGDPNPKILFWWRKIRGATQEIDAIIKVGDETLAIETKKKQTKSKSLKEVSGIIKRKIIVRLEESQTLIPFAVL